MAWVCSDVFIFYFFYLLWPVLEVEEEREVVGACRRGGGFDECGCLDWFMSCGSLSDGFWPWVWLWVWVLAVGMGMVVAFFFSSSFGGGGFVTNVVVVRVGGCE